MPLSLSWATTVFTVSAGIRNTDRSARRREDCGVYPDDIAFHVEGWSAGIALIHRRIDLDEVVIGTGTNVTATSRNDTSRHRPTKAERIADCDNPVANTRRHFCKLDVREITAAIHLDEGKISARIGADHLGIISLAVIGRDLDRF